MSKKKKLKKKVKIEAKAVTRKPEEKVVKPEIKKEPEREIKPEEVKIPRPEPVELEKRETKGIPAVRFFSIIPPTVNINFMGRRKIASVASAFLCAISIFMLTTGKLPLGTDFKGGTLIEVRFEKAVEISSIRAIFPNATVQNVGGENEFVIKTPLEDTSPQAVASGIKKTLGKFGKFELRKVETVGASIGKDLRRKGILAACFALFGILIYCGIRFQLRFAIGAITALIHDLLIAILGMCLLKIDMSLVTLAALLALAGYSVNDSIVIVDRIREKMRTMARESDEFIFNRAINETLPRTCMTTLTTLFATVALIVIGREVLRDFATVLLIGFIVGTYSSIFVTSSLALQLSKKKAFTMVELLIVLAIIAVLMSLAIPQYRKFQLRAKASEAKINISLIYGLEEAYAAEKGFYLTEGWKPGGASPKKQEWVESDDNFKKLGFKPSGKVFCNYAIAEGDQTDAPASAQPSACEEDCPEITEEVDITIIARCDLDGDGKYSYWVATDENREVLGPYGDDF